MTKSSLKNSLDVIGSNMGLLTPPTFDDKENRGIFYNKLLLFSIANVNLKHYANTARIYIYITFPLLDLE